MHAEALPLLDFFGCFARATFPQEMQHAQNIQNIFPVAEGDHESIFYIQFELTENSIPKL